MPRERSATARAAIPRTGFISDADSESPEATVIDVVATDFEASGFLCNWTVACGIDLGPGVEAGTLAVSFFASAWSGDGATGLRGVVPEEGGFGAAGGIVADGSCVGPDGGTGATGGTVGGLGAIEGIVAAGGVGGLGIPGAEGGGGTMPPPLEGGFGIPGIEGGLGMLGGGGGRFVAGGFSPVGSEGP